MSNPLRKEMRSVYLSGYPTSLQPCSFTYAAPCSVCLDAGASVALLSVVTLSLSCFTSAKSLVVLAHYAEQQGYEQEFIITTLHLKRRAGAPLCECIYVDAPHLSTPSDSARMRYVTCCPAVICNIAKKDDASDRNNGLSASALIDKWATDNCIVSLHSVSDLLCLNERTCIVRRNTSRVCSFALIAASDEFLRLLLQTLQSALGSSLEIVVKRRFDCYDSNEEDEFMHEVASVSNALLDEHALWASLLREQHQKRHLMPLSINKDRRQHYRLGVLESISESDLARLYSREDVTDDAMRRLFAAFANTSFNI